MTILFQDGFETLNTWTISKDATATVEASSSYAHHGNYSLHANVIDIPGWTYGTLQKTISAVSEIYCRFYIKINSHSLLRFNDRNYCCVLRNTVSGGTTVVWVGWRVDWYGNVKWELMIRNAGGYFNDMSTSSLEVGQIYCVEVYLLEANPNGVSILYVDGIEVARYEGITDSFGLINQIQIGCPGAYRGMDVNIDCCVVADAYIGQQEVNNLVTLVKGPK